MKIYFVFIIFALLVLNSACKKNESQDVNPSSNALYGYRFVFSNGEIVSEWESDYKDAYRIYYPNQLSNFTGFDATQYDYVSALSLDPTPSNNNDFSVDLIMTIPARSSLMNQLSLPDTSDQIYISAPESTSIDNLFGLDYTFDLKQDNRIYYSSFWTPPGDSIRHQNIIDRVELVKQNGNSFELNGNTEYTNYYRVEGRITSMMQRGPDSTSNFPKYLSLQGYYSILIEVWRD